MAWLTVAATVSACAADAKPGSATTNAGVCPLRAGVLPSQIDVFDGDPVEQVFLAPDDDGKGANTYTVKHVYAQGRAVTVRCHYGKEAVDVKLTQPVVACRYLEVGARSQLACK